jgi:hypothetical protein
MTLVGTERLNVRQQWHMLLASSLTDFNKHFIMDIDDLVKFTRKTTEGKNLNYGPDAPPSVLQYHPDIWKEDEVWHTVLGRLPDECIWTTGTTLQESLQQFDKELRLSLQANGTIKFLTQEERQRLHKPVWDKINLS